LRDSRIRQQLGVREKGLGKTHCNQRFEGMLAAEILLTKALRVFGVLEADGNVTMR
jgi:hypothetical protein